MLVHLAMIAIVGLAQPGEPTDPAQPTFDHIGAKFRDPTLPAAERGRLIDEALRTCDARLAVNDGDWPMWAVRASELHLERLAIDGTELTVLFGLPSDHQRERARIAGASALRLAKEARAKLEGSTQDFAPLWRGTARAMIVRAGGLVYASFLGLGAGKDAKVNDPLRIESREAIQASAYSPFLDPADRAEIDEFVLGTSNVVTDPQTLLRLAAQWRAALNRIMILDGARPAEVVAAAHVVMERARRGTSEQQFAVTSLMAESAARAYLDAHAPRITTTALTDAVEAMSLFTAEMQPASVARTWAIEKLSWRADESWPLDDAPLLAVLARARALDRVGARLSAAKILESAAARFEGSDRLDAKRARLRLLMIEAEAARSKQLSIDAITLGLDMHREFPDATGHLESCLIIAKTLTTRADTDDADFKRFEQWLDVGLANPSALGELDYWRFQRGDYRSTRAANIDESLAALKDFDSVDPASPIRELANARFREGAIVALAKASAQAAELRKEDDPEAVRRFSADQWLPLARMANDWAERSLQEPLPTITRALADAMVEAGIPGADPAYRTLIATAVPASSESLELALGMARALLLAEKPDQAFALLREVATASDSPTADGHTRPERYWHAWTLMLETLLAQDDSPRQRTAIRTRLTQLESVDAALGGPPWNRRLGRIREAVSR